MWTVAPGVCSGSNPLVTTDATSNTRSGSATPPVRIAMWSGPRNISTAMMRSWGSRADTSVVDEPFYAHYLQFTGADHPGRDEVIASHECDWRRVAGELTGPVPGGRRIYYQKHMAHHVLDHMSLDWLGSLTHAFLIREPAAMLASLNRVLPRVRLEDTGLPQQLRLYEFVTKHTGQRPPVIDSRDVLEAPADTLRLLCNALSVPWDPAMLEWAPGPRATDGVWARHWYGAVEASTGFAPYQEKNPRLPAGLDDILGKCESIYRALAAHRLAGRAERS